MRYQTYNLWTLGTKPIVSGYLKVGGGGATDQTAKGDTQDRLTGRSFSSLQDILLGGGGGDILLSSPAHAGSSGRLPAPGVPIPGLRPSKFFQQPPHPHS